MNPNLNYRPEIDGLRAVAVLAVVLHHLSAPLVRGGPSPVIASGRGSLPDMADKIYSRDLFRQD